MKIDICYIISHGFSARMLLQTGLITQLTQRGKHIAIISPDPEDPNLLDLKDNPNITVFDSELKHSIWDDNYDFKRKYYLEDIKSNPVFWEKHLHSILYSKSKHPWKRIRPFYYYIIHWLIAYFPSIRKRFKATESKHLVAPRADEILNKINPSLVVSTYPVNFIEAKFLYAAKQKNIPTLIHLLSWDNITSKGIFPVIPDHFIVWGKVMYNELKAYYGVKDEAIQICGVPHFDQHISVKKSPNFKPILEKLGLNPNLPYLFFAMSSPRFAPYEIDIVEQLAIAVQNEVFGAELQLIVRPHPQNVQGSLADKRWIKRLDNLKGKSVAVDYPQLNDSKVRWSMKKTDMGHLSNLLAGCSICLNSGSTVSIDALMMDKPVILTSFDGDKKLYYWKSARRLIDYLHLKKFIKMGGAKPVHDYAELYKMIEKYLNEPDFNRDQRQYALQMECHLNDGQSTLRVVEAMMHLLEKTAPVYV